MSKDTKVPQAFPYSGVGDDMNYSKGMTLRDYFAAKAMGSVSGVASTLLRDAEEAYKIADAMIIARNKK